jgi:hypothetical protein
MSSTTMDASAVRRKAADIIAARGWHQGGFAPDGGDLNECPVDVLGAINVALGHSPREFLFEASTVAMTLAKDLDLECDPGQLVEVLSVGWNDAEGRTADEVMDALRDRNARQ